MSHETAEQIEPTKREFATLTVSNHGFCVDIEEIKETRRWSEITMLPHSPDYVMGAMNLRGIIIPIIDLALRLGMPATTPTDRHVIVVIDHDGQTVGLVADSVREIVSIATNEIHKPPAMAQNEAENYISGLFTHAEHMVRILDVPSILNCVQGELV